MSVPIAIDQPYRHFATEDLLKEWECWRWQLAELDAGLGDWQYREESRAFVFLRLTDVQLELDRRRRLQGKRHAPAWPKRTPEQLKEELTEIKYRLELARYVEEHSAAILVPRGRTLWAPCPLPGHEESTASFHVDPDKQVWHCFGCGRGGDLFEFARQLYGVGEFWRIVERLRAEAGLEEPEKAPQRFVRGGLAVKRPDGTIVPLRARP